MIAPGYDLTRLDMVFMKKSIDFIEQHEKTEPNNPFFLYHCTSAVHLPSFAAKEFLGKTKAGPLGDYKVINCVMICAYLRELI